MFLFTYRLWYILKRFSSPIFGKQGRTSCSVPHSKVIDAHRWLTRVRNLARIRMSVPCIPLFTGQDKSKFYAVPIFNFVRTTIQNFPKFHVRNETKISIFVFQFEIKRDTISKMINSTYFFSLQHLQQTVIHICH